MANGRRGSVLKSIETLFQVGAVGAMADAELLELFLTRQEAAEAAFEALVRRHGPMVFGVCRGVLPDPNDAEDAFQATFLVLARRASSIRLKGSIGGWLHGVARRVAMRAKVDAIRRRLHENQAAERHPRRETTGDALPDLARILHEELGRLPEKYRAPVLLCDAEGLTHESAAQRLGWPVGTVSGRLSRAHGLLRDRLKRRGVEPGAIAVGAVAVPSSLIGATARAAIQFAAKGGVRGAAGAVPAGAIALAEGVLKMMSITRTIVAGAIVMAGVGLTTTGVGVLAVRGQGAGEKPKDETAMKEPAKAPKPQEFRVKIIDPGPGGIPNPEVLKTIREAARAAETIPGPGVKSIALILVAEAYATAEDLDSARSTYHESLRIVEEGIQGKENVVESGGEPVFLDQPGLPYFRYILRIAESQAKHNFIEDAAETIKKMNPKFGLMRNEMLTELAKALAQDGKIQAALRLANNIESPMGMHTKDSLLVEIALIQAMEFPKTDRKWIDELTDPAVKSRVLLGVAAGLSGQGYKPSKYRPHGPR
jgi:RNA polymerase sigma factor (sigma-70 family)